MANPHRYVPFEPVELTKVRGKKNVFLCGDRWTVTVVKENEIEVYDKLARPPRVVARLGSLNQAKGYLAHLITPNMTRMSGKDLKSPRVGGYA